VSAKPKPLGRVAAGVGRYLGAVSLLLVAAVHAQQYYEAYFYVLPTIGTLSLLAPKLAAPMKLHPSGV
jgi:hypothetical protein